MLCGMSDLPVSEIEPVSPALASEFSPTEPPGKPAFLPFKLNFFFLQIVCKQ